MKTNYICEKCGKIFNTETEALECEKRHEEIAKKKSEIKKLKSEKCKIISDLIKSYCDEFKEPPSLLFKTGELLGKNYNPAEIVFMNLLGEF